MINFCLMTHQPLWIILCCLLEKGRNWSEELVQERKVKEEGKGKWQCKTEEILTLCLLFILKNIPHHS